MSGFGSGFGFGQNNNNNQQQQQQGSTFGSGFGAAANTGTGFGSTANNTGGFGSTANTGGGLFGGTSGGFGSSGGAFGNQQPSAFGSKPTFGAATSTGGGLFGANTATANSGGAFGGFGATTAANASPFGAANTGTGGLFGGANKPAFGATTGTTSTPFGASNTTGFGATQSTFGGSGTSLGGPVGDCQGTGAVPFQAHIEKEPNTASNQQNAFQSIVFQQPYQKFSPEELRLADYAQGRRYGNASGQPGAFGASNGFGGFGNNNTTSAFGSNTNTGTGLFGATPSTTPFGQNNQTAATPFGTTNTTGGIFGQKPAATGGGLFGAQPTPASGTGGLFGGATNTTFGNNNNTSAFGSTNTGTTSLFGNNTNQSKPGFSFGNQQPAASGTSFGATSTGTTGGFGSGGALFGNNTQAQNTSNPFGGAAQPAASNPFGGFGNAAQPQTGTTNLFGATQQKPATGLFGSTTNNATPGSSVFGNATNTATPFGAASNTTQGSSLFAPKPATGLGGSNLFGASNNTNTNTSNTGGLFGNFGSNQNNQTQQNQNTGSSLFGGLGQQPQRPSLFGAQSQSSGGGLFGGNTNTQGGSSLFGNVNNNQSQQSQPQTSLFGGSQTTQQSQPQTLTASINDPSAFGISMFSNLASPQAQNPGPLATPLSSLSKQKRSGALPLYKMNPASASRLSTPQKRGFGFSYSTYGTPGSASSTSSTPITFGNSMLGGGFGRGLSKSVSTSSLRGSYTSSFNREDSILAPGAFSASPSSRFNSTGSMKKLVINRSIRTDLFSPPAKDSSPSASQGGILKKRVSFDSSTSAANSNGIENGNGFASPLKQVQSSSTSSTEEQGGFLRSSLRTNNGNGNGGKTNGAPSQPEMEQVKGNELAIVPEEEAPAPALLKHRATSTSREDQEPGRYWMSPSKEEVINMNRIQRQKVSVFTVGREGVGQVTFDTPVDLTNIDLDAIFDKIVILAIRSATVYPDQSKKPPVGKGLNVPSTIMLENSWPRGKDKRNPSHEKAGPRFQKHVERLSKVPDTHFKDYDRETGVWTFSVEHFTTYGLEYDDDDETDGDVQSEFGQSTLSAPPDTPTPQSRTPKMQAEVSFSSSELSGATESDPEDTFDFKKKRILPGAFDEQTPYGDDAEMDDGEEDSQSFLDERSVGSESENGVEEPMDQDDVFQDRELVRIEDEEMAGSFPQLDGAAEHDDEYSQEEVKKENTEETPGAIVRARMRAMRTTGSPLKRKLKLDDDDWTEMLRQTVSPQKQDREQLKRMRDSIPDGPLVGVDAKEVAPVSIRNRVVSDGRGFATSIDLMHSLFGESKSQAKSSKVPQKGKGFEWPYAKQSKTSNLNDADMDPAERGFHDSLKPSWDATGTLVYTAPVHRKSLSNSAVQRHDQEGLLVVQKSAVTSEGRDVKFARFSNESTLNALQKQKSITTITNKDGVPFAQLQTPFKYSDFLGDKDSGDQATAHEKLVWQLASVLFDHIDVPEDLHGVPHAANLLRKDKLSAFWQKLVGQACSRYVAMAKSHEEKAIACLAGHRISEACGHLLNGDDYHLATLTALIGGNNGTRKDIKSQLDDWRKSAFLAEFSQPVRALYELLAGNVCVCDGLKGSIEDRIETFVISQRFGFDWRQAFGLRLWYAILKSDDLARAVQLFSEDLEQDKEPAKPQAWYVEQGISPLWDDKALDSREDLLWGLLKLYAFHDIDLESVLRPENSQLSPVNVRLSWQLSKSLTASGKASYGMDHNEKTDKLTLSLASQLTNEGNWVDAVFALLHLSSASVRAKSIRDHLAHHAGRIGPEDGQNFTTMVRDLHIPTSWVWEAKALYMRSVLKDSRGEVGCLLRAGAFQEAHRTFSREVAPRTVIERDWETLRTLLAGFRGRESSITEWHLGGELYADYLSVVESDKKGQGKIDGMLLERLLAALPAMAEDGRHASFLETVAVQEMSGVVARMVVDMSKQGLHRDLPRLLRLPLTEDKYLKHTVDLSLSFYKSVMTGGR